MSTPVNNQPPAGLTPPLIPPQNWPPKTVALPKKQQDPAPYPDFDDRDISQRPWTHVGYRGFSRVIACDKNFFIARRFGVLNARVVLFLQDEIVELETKLDRLDQENSRKDVDDIDNGTFRNDGVEGRRELIRKIYEKLKEYNEYVNSCAEIAQKPAAPHRNVSSLRNWLGDRCKGAIADPEANYITHSDDLFVLAPKDKAPIRVVLEKFRWFHDRLFRKGMPDPTYQDPAVILQDDKAVDRFSATVIGVIGSVFLVAPLWILNAFSGITERLGIITGFLMLFMLLTTLGTTAKVFESLAASAAYAAVLMVFLQVNSG